MTTPKLYPVDDWMKRSAESEDAEVKALCERIGYGNVMSTAARLWLLKDPNGAFTVGPCAAIAREATARDIEAVRVRLRIATAQAGSLRAYARKTKVSPAYVSDVLNGRREPGVGILRPLGFEKHVVREVAYVRKEKS